MSTALFAACAALALSAAAASAQTVDAARTAAPDAADAPAKPAETAADMAAGALAAAVAPAAATAPAMSVAPAAAAATPAAKTDVIETMRAKGEFSVMLKALDAANLTSRLKASPGVTVFAPTDAAFAALPAGAVDKLLAPQNAEELRKVLLHHTVNAKVDPAQLANRKGMVKTAAEDELTVDGADGRIMADEATVTADMPATNGTVFAIDKVITPDGVTLAAGAAD